MKEKLEWLWNNIMSIYIDKGVDYRCKVDNLLIMSNDNYFECYSKQDMLYNDYSFKISIEYSFSSEPKIYFEPYSTYNDIDLYIDKLKPIFRNNKINELLLK